MNSSNDAASQATAQQKQQQAAIASATDSINKNFAGFNPGFYQGYTNANVNYGLGQLAPQLQQTQDQLGFKLAGQGLGKSSQADKLGESLQTETGNQKQNIVNNALGATNTLEQNVNQQKSNLINEANVANDPASVANQSLGIASGFSSPSPIAPIGQAFGNWANTWLGASNSKTYGSSLPSSASYGGNGSGSTYGGYGGSLMNPVSSVAY